MEKFAKLFIFLLLPVISGTASAGVVSVGSLHFWTSAKQSRVMLDVSAVPVHKVLLLHNPERLVIDVDNARSQKRLPQPPASHPFVSEVRVDKKPQGVKITAFLKRQVNYDSFTLNPNKMYGYRVVVDLTDKGPLAGDAENLAKSEKPARAVAKLPAIAAAAQKQPAPPKTREVSAPKVKLSSTPSRRKIVVAIDAGHGGDDPGAHGPGGTEEKKVVLAIAKKVAALIDAQKGMRAVLVRKGDYFVDLRKRMRIARAANADLFVSIHADAFQRADVKGASVFMLSNRGASSEAARWLADSENASDLVGGVRLDDKEEVLASVLLDLSQTATLEASNNVAGHVLRSFRNIGELHFDSVQKAGFLVLKSPDIPSILVETAFISNPDEERKLKSSDHQDKIARAIFKGVRSYFNQFSPTDTRVAENTAALRSGM